MVDTPKKERLHATDYAVRTESPISAGLWHITDDVGLHDHDFVELNVIVGGTAVHRSAQGEHPVGRGNAALLLPGAWHAYDKCVELNIYNCIFKPELLRRELTWMQDEPSLNYFLFAGPLLATNHALLRARVRENAMAQCVEHLNALPPSYPTPDSAPYAHGEAVGRLTLLLSLLADQLLQPKAGVAAGANVRRPRMHPLVDDVLRIFNADITHNWGLTELADKLLCDPSHLSRVCHKELGLPPLAYLARMRADRAAALLVKTNLPINEVADTVGWCNSNYFAKRFRQHFGMSASAYRARHAPGAVKR